MKRRFLSLIALLLLLCTVFLCACGETEPPVADPPAIIEPPPTPPVSGDVFEVYDPSLPMNDPEIRAFSYLYSDGGLLKQPESSIYPTSSVARADAFAALAKAEDIIARGRPETPVYGIYTFAEEYLDNQDMASRVGFTNARMSHYTYTSEEDGLAYAGLTDEQMFSFCETGISIVWVNSLPICKYRDAYSQNTFFYPDRYGFERNDVRDYMRDYAYIDLSGWLYQNANMAITMLDRYGPRGSFFTEHPNVNYNPIRYLEIINEPNFQYNIPAKRDDGSDDAYAAIKFEAYAMLHTVITRVVREKYGDEVKIVGMCAGGGAEESGKAFVTDTIALAGNERVEGILNDALTSSAIVKFDKDINGKHFTESDADFKQRQDSADKLRVLLNLEADEKLTIDVVRDMDIMSIHPYIEGTTPFSAFTKNNNSQAYYINEMRKAILKGVDENDTAEYERAKNMPIWFTECGWQLKGQVAYAEAYPEDEANGIKGGLSAEYTNKATGTSQIIQAAMEIQDYLFGIRNGIDRITYMHIYDTDNCNYGLLNFGNPGTTAPGGGDYSWRLTLYSIQNMIKLMPNPALVNVVAEGAGDKFYSIYEIEADVGGEIVTTVFTPLEATTVDVPWDSTYALVTDMFGKSEIVRAQNGIVTVDAGPYMLYLREVPAELLVEHGLVSDGTSDISHILSHAWLGKEDIL